MDSKSALSSLPLERQTENAASAQDLAIALMLK